MKDYPDVEMFNDCYGVPFFQASLCGEYRFKSAKAAQAACDAARADRDTREKAAKLLKANRLEIDLGLLEVRIHQSGQQVATVPIRDKRHARQIVFELEDQWRPEAICWV